MNDYSDILAGAAAPAAETPEPTEPKPKRKIIRLVLVFLAMAGLGAGGVAVKSATAEDTHTIVGLFSLNDSPSYSRYSSSKTGIFAAGGVCQGGTDSGYSDIGPMTQVKVSDTDGKPLVITHLGAGKPGEGESSSGYINECIFAWTAEDVPKRDFYVVEVGRRGELTYSYEQMEDMAWILATSLGD